LNFFFTKKNVLFIVSNLASAFLGLLITIMIARLYSKDSNANYQFYLSFLQISCLLGWARADQFLTSVNSPPRIKSLIIYFIKNQYLNWLFVIVLSIFFIFYTGNKFIENTFSLVVILISGYFFGLTNIANQYLIIDNRYQYQGVFDLFQKIIFLLLIVFLTTFNIYLGLLMLFSMLIRLFIFQVNNNELNKSEDTSNLNIMITNGRRMLVANALSNAANFLIIFLISRVYSKSFYADYALVSILISFPASVLGQYIGLMIHRRYVNGNKDFAFLVKLLSLITFFIILMYALLPQFKYLIIQTIGEKWSTIWNIYNLLWPLSIFTLLASILERTGYEFGNKLWPIFISFIRFLGIFLLVLILLNQNLFHFEEVPYFNLLVFVLFSTYIIDLCRNLFILYKVSKS